MKQYVCAVCGQRIVIENLSNIDVSKSLEEIGREVAQNINLAILNHILETHASIE